MGNYTASTAAIDHNMYVKGDYVFQANYRAGLRILDISDVANANLFEEAYFDIYPSSDSANFNGSWSNYPYFSNGMVIISGIEQGLFVVQPTTLPIEPPVACDSPTDIPWLTVSPDNGSTAEGSSSMVNVGFDSTGLTAGDYTASLCIGSNAVTTPELQVPITLTVLPNQVPVAVADAYTTTQDTAVSIAAPGVLNNDSDGDGDGLTAVLDTTTSNGTLTFNADGSFDYTPDAGFEGDDTFTYHATDGMDDSNTVTVTISVLNTAPMAVSDSYSTTEGITLTVVAPGVLMNDSDDDGDGLTAVLDTTTNNGTLTLNADGSFVYAPDVGFSGTDSFTYHADDGTDASNVVTVTITVSGDSGYIIFLPFVSHN